MPSHAIELANAIAPRWASWIASATVDSIVLLAAVSLLWLLIRRRAAPQIGYFLFLLVSLRLLSPIEISVPSRMAQWIPSQWIPSHSVTAWLAHNPTEITAAPPPADLPAALRSAGVEDRASELVRRTRAPSHVEQSIEQMAIAATHAPLSQAPAAPPAVTLRAVSFVFLAWLAIVALLAARFAWGQLMFAVRIRRARAVDDPQLLAEFRSLCARAGLRRTVRFVQSDQISTPAAWGLFRPTIILPFGIRTSLNEKQLRWVLSHELAHLKRHDPWTMLIQRLAAILNFFDPAVWIANRAANHLRECACDDFATLLSEGTGIESSEAFVRLLRDECQSQRSLEGALGIFGLDSRAACFARVRRMLDMDRPCRARLGWFSFVGLLVLAVAALPHLRAATGDDRPSKTAAAHRSPDANSSDAGQAVSPTGTATATAEMRTFTLTVVGPDHKPLPGITVGCHVSPPLQNGDLLIGSLVKKNKFNWFVKLDEHGQLQLRLLKNPTLLGISIETPGFGPYLADWSSRNHPEAIPQEFVAELDAAWSVGGIVVDEGGKPIGSATVEPNINPKKRPGDTEQMRWFGEVTTNAKGEWHYDSVPVSENSVDVFFWHRKFVPGRFELARSDYELKPGFAPTEKTTLEHGISLTGTVTDERGHPIAGALVRTGDSVPLNNREATTGADGKYQLYGFPISFPLRQARIAVSAKGRAPDVSDVDIYPFMKPVDFQLKPGRTLRVRVLDPHGRPVPHAEIYFEQWRGPMNESELGDERHYADEHGVWVWHEAPPDEMQAEIGGDNNCMDLMYQPLVARKQEYVVHLLPLLVISGNVIDAETKRPIKAFRVNQAITSGAKLVWLNNDSFAGTDGHFQVRQRYQYDGFAVKVEADGYKPLTSRVVKSDEGNVSLEFALRK